MFSPKPNRLTLALIFTIALALALASSSDAKGYAAVNVNRRQHGNLGRMIKKRSPLHFVAREGDTGVDQTSNQNSALDNPQPIGPGAQPSSLSPSTVQTTTPVTTVASTAAAITSGTTDTLVDITTAALSTSSTTATSSATSSTTSSTSTSSTSTSSSTTSSSLAPVTSATPTSTSAATATPTLNLTGAPAAVTASASTLTITSSSTNAAPTSTPQSSDDASVSSADKRTTYTVLIVIGACVGGAAIIWTIIRKWKFKPSSQFEDRMQPIDWQPTNPDDEGLPGHRRMGSGTSSFHSGIHDDNVNGRGMGGHGGPFDNSYSAPAIAPIPDHDFTAPAANLAPVGGYADLARGPSPQPMMQEALTRGPSIGRQNYDQHAVPLHHQAGYVAHDAYNYNAGGY